MLADNEFLGLQTALAGEYSIEREIGRGGMGIVYLAHDVHLERMVAIKVLPAALALRVDLRERFLREARTAAGLSHPHIVPIHRVGVAGGFVFFVMSYVPGETLGQRLQARGPMPAAEGVRMLREVAWALAYAHGRGVVHRDVKPENILLEADTGRALVTDFGIARVHTAAEITDPGQVMGTAHFMSPEQAAGDPIDGRSDLYSLGVVAFLALGGRLPFEAGSAAAILAKHLSEPAPPLASVAPGIPRRLAAAIDRCLRKRPEERWPTGEALAEALEPASLVRAQLPTPLRAWLQSQVPGRAVYLVWSGIFTMGAFSELASSGRSNFWLLALFAVMPLIPITVFHLRSARKIFHVGYSLADLRAAIRSWQEQRREELAFELGDKVPLYHRVLRLSAWASVLAFVLSPLLYESRGAAIYRGLQVGLAFAMVGTVAASNALGVPLFGGRLRHALIGGLRARFWNSRLGGWTAKLLGAGSRGTADQFVSRPTELALGIAAADLYAALPARQRQQLGDLPDVVRALEARAVLARRSLELPERHDEARRELAQSVGALESIRLDLLRMHAGTDARESLTEVLEAARRVGRDVDRILEGRRITGEVIEENQMPRPSTPV